MKTITKISHIEQVRQSTFTLAEQVCRILNWSHEEYCDFQFAKYNAFIDLLFAKFPLIGQQVRYSSVFRGFWNNEVCFRNEIEFLPFATEMTEDIYEINADGELIIAPAFPYGHEGLVNEFLFIHSIPRLINHELFMMKYNNILEVIR